VNKNLLFVLACTLTSLKSASADLVGHWTFESGTELKDSTGNFPDLLLMGDAEVKDGKLAINGAGTDASGWAITDSDSGEYQGPDIIDKTLVSWVTLQSLEDVAKAGSAITIDRVSADIFDGIIYAERQPNRWMNGSSGFQRTEDFDPGIEETTVDEPRFLAITYEHVDGNLQITGYADGEPIGEYSKGTSEWSTGDAEVIFGKRHGSTGGGPGALDALIEEARVYDEALSAEAVQQLFLEGPAGGDLVGQWTFEGGEELTDRRGNFPPLLLMGDATVTVGKLKVTGSGTDASGWAITDSDNGSYQGLPIVDKTLMAWVTMDSLEDGAKAGSALTLDRVSGDHFDGIIYAERQANRFMNGSSGFGRTEDFDPGFEETLTGEPVHIAITYQHVDGVLQVTGYRNGDAIGQYSKGESSWDTDDAEAIFGKRHGSTGGGPGAINATIDEARIYNAALTADRIKQVFDAGAIVGADRDNDGLPDAWEQQHFANLDETPEGDPDGDQLTNIDELARNTLPNKADSDDDAYSDLVETNTGIFVSVTDTGTDPNNADTDGDGLSDGLEQNTGVFPPALDGDGAVSDTGTNPLLADTDGDRFQDLAELERNPPSNPSDDTDPPVTISDFLVGHWTFDAGNELKDLTGNFPDIVLQGDAAIENGMLDLNGTGTDASGWAITDSDSGEYQGAEITDKTLVAWVTLESLEDSAKAGSAITIDRISGDVFDGIIYAERQPNRWMNGSSGFQRTQDFDPGFEETAETLGQQSVLAITCEHLDGNQLRVTGYRNGEPIGTYETANASTWDTGDAEVIFGKRHGSTGGGPGALDALIDEARVYRTALTPEQVKQISGALPEPVGFWTFESGQELIDQTGNFPELLLMGDAVVANGKLDVNGVGTNASGWAITDSDSGEYTGPLIENKTLVSWVTLESLENEAKAGSAITIDRISGDTFDGIIFAEREPNRWMNGSSGFQRTQDWDPGFEETKTDEVVMMAITYEVIEDFGDLKITGYRNGEEIGQYETGNASSWDPGDAEILFGKRHGSTGGGPGALDALIEQASIYNVALSPGQIGQLFSEGFVIPEDSDNDGLSDEWERENFPDLAQAADGDPDGDGVSNVNEFLRQLDPNNDDTDGDGLTDLVETDTGTFVNLTDTGTDPRSDDTDGDGLKDGAETNTGTFVSLADTGTDPNNDNTDNDRIPDGTEVENGTNPHDPNDPPPPPISDLLLGQWTFEPGEELIDRTGNFPDLLLKDDGEAAVVTVVDGRGVLDINGSGTDSTGWAVTNSDEGEYVGPTIENKTLVAWVTLESLEDVAKAGSVITIDRISNDTFDGIIFAEREFNRWMAGSSGFQRTQNWDPGFEEETAGEPVMMAISYEHLDNGIEVTGYHNGEEIGNYVAGVKSSWEPGDAEIFFGKRHGSTGGGPGGLDALIDEARLYGDVLTAAQIEQLFREGPGGAGDRFKITDVVRETNGNVTLTWESQPGQLFAIEESVSLSATWEVIGTNIPAANAPSASTSATVEIDPNLAEAFYRVLRIPPPPLFVADFEDGMGEWTVGVIDGLDATDTSWEFGTPTAGPGVAFSGINAVGTDLDADYVDATGIFLRSPVIDLTGIARPKLEFQYFLEAGDGEGGRLNVLEADGLIIDTVGIFDGSEQGVTEWTTHTVRLPELNRPVIIEFELLSEVDDAADNGAGWYLDDVVIDD
jgi:hypothetical protein